MEARLRRLEGQTVTDAVELHDYAQLYFGPNTILSVYNRHSCSPEGVSIADLKGSMVTRVHESKDSVVLEFLPRGDLYVDLRQEAYLGPEAMTLHVKGEPVVVWN